MKASRLNKLSEEKLEKALEIVAKITKSKKYRLSRRKRSLLEQALNKDGVKLSELLYTLYWMKKLSSYKLKEIFKLSSAYAAYKWLHAYNIDTRGNIREDIRTKELVREYVSNKVSIYKLAKKYKCARETIRYRLIKAGINIRDNRPISIWSQATIQEGISALKGYIICAIFGDNAGNTRTNKYRTHYVGICAGRDRDFAELFAECVEKEYGLELKIYRKSDNQWIARRSCKPIWKDLRRYAKFGKNEWQLTRKGMEEFGKLPPRDLGFALSGFFDAEGTVSRSITADSVNRKGLELIRFFLDKLGIKSTIRGPYRRKPNESPIYVLYINTHKQNLIKFKELVNFNVIRKRAVLNKLIPLIKSPA